MWSQRERAQQTRAGRRWPGLFHILVPLFSRPVVSDSLPPHGRQHTRLPCPSPSPRWWCPLSWRCHPTSSSSFCLQSLPASRSFPMSRLFTSGGQSIGISTSARHLPNVNMHIVYQSKLTMLMGGGKRTHGLSLTQISPVAKELKMINNGTQPHIHNSKATGVGRPFSTESHPSTGCRKHQGGSLITGKSRCETLPENWSAF